MFALLLLPTASDSLPQEGKGRETAAKTSSMLFILNYSPLFTARCKNVKVVVRIGLRDAAEVLARCLTLRWLVL